MFSRNTVLVSIVLILLSGMFLIGQDADWPTPESKIVFVTNGLYLGDLGGLSGADALCQAEAVAAGLDGTYRAWLSDSSDAPAYRFVLNDGPYKLVDGTIVADN